MGGCIVTWNPAGRRQSGWWGGLEAPRHSIARSAALYSIPLSRRTTLHIRNETRLDRIANHWFMGEAIKQKEGTVMNKEYTTSGERGVATRFVRAAINAGYTVSVYDGEEYTVKRSCQERKILDALASTEADTLLIRNGAGERIGAAMLIWGNDESGEELIADHTDNEIMGALVEAAQR